MKTTILIILSLALVLSTKAQSNQKAVKSKVGPDIVAYQEAGSLAQGQNQPKRKKQRRGGRGGSAPGGKRKPTMSDTLRANVYADNTFIMYINGNLVAVDSIEFIPHNVVSVDVLPEYPMTIAVMAKDNADQETGMEYENTNIGDGGFILKIGEKIVSGKHWKAKNFFHGPIKSDEKNLKVIKTTIPNDWFKAGFDDSSWPSAKVFQEDEIGPKQPYFDHDFTGAKWIWSDDIKLDNTVIFRLTVDGPEAGFYTGR